MATRPSWTVYTGFYWIGTAMMLACFALILAGNTEPVYQFEHTRFPLSWVFAIVAIFAFLAAEFCHPVETLANEMEARDAELIPDWEGVEV
jgi:hypothetical protein